MEIILSALLHGHKRVYGINIPSTMTYAAVLGDILGTARGSRVGSSAYMLKYIYMPDLRFHEF